jgi:hypothetical protein
MDLVHDINEEAWAEWIDWRHKEKRKKVTPTAAKKQRKMLSQYNPVIQQQIIDQSIMSDWQGLFPPKQAQTCTERANQNAARQIAQYQDVAGWLE